MQKDTEASPTVGYIAIHWGALILFLRCKCISILIYISRIQCLEGKHLFRNYCKGGVADIPLSAKHPSSTF